jgi:hypothetical protein
VGSLPLEQALEFTASTTQTATPSPQPIAPGVEADLVTPGVIGFVFTAVFIIAVILLVIDMTKRMRRVRYRAEARERIAAELDAQVEGELPPEPVKSD